MTTFDERRLFLASAAGIAAHQVQSYVLEPKERLFRVLVLLGLGVGATAFWRASEPGAGLQGRRGGIALAVGAGPTFGAVVGHIVPLVREGRIVPASETASYNLGCGVLLLALGASLLRRRGAEALSSFRQ